MPEQQMYVSGEELGLPTPMTVEDSGTITLNFRVTSVSKDHDMETGAETDDVRYTLEVNVLSIEVNEVSLKDSLRRSFKEQNGDSPPMVRVQIAPSPGG